MQPTFLYIGTGTSDSILARVSSGEAVINANSTQLFRPVLSYLNELGGGKPFGGYATGGIPLPRPVGSMDGGLMSRTLGAVSLPSAYEIAHELAKVIPTEIGVKTITNAQKKQATVVRRATLGS